MTTAVRFATVADVEGITALTRELGYAAETAEMQPRLERMLERGDQAIFVAENEEAEVVGWLQVTTSEIIESGFRADIVGLVVADRARRQGIGRMLVQRAEQWARTRSAPVIGVRSNLTRAESHPFYLSLGYSNTKNQAVYRKILG